MKTRTNDCSGNNQNISESRNGWSFYCNEHRSADAFNSRKLAFPRNWRGQSDARLCAVAKRSLSEQIETAKKQRDTGLWGILQAISNALREKGAGHLSDEIEGAAPDQLPALVEAIDIGGFHEEAAELQTVVSEIFNSVNNMEI